VLLKPTLSPYDTLVLDRGTQDGVAVNDVVFAASSTPIGFISSVTPGTSLATLYSAPGQKTSVLVGVKALAKQAVGLGGGNFQVTLPANAPVAVGDPVSLPFSSTNIFALITAIDAKATDATEAVRFVSPVSIADIRYVLVVHQKK